MFLQKFVYFNFSQNQIVSFQDKMGSGGYHSSRAEFLSDEAILKYNRNGGCFVTTKKAIAFVVFALTSLLIVVLLMYFYGPTRESERVSKFMKMWLIVLIKFSSSSCLI